MCVTPIIACATVIVRHVDDGVQRASCTIAPWSWASYLLSAPVFTGCQPHGHGGKGERPDVSGSLCRLEGEGGGSGVADIAVILEMLLALPRRRASSAASALAQLQLGCPGLGYSTLK